MDICCAWNIYSELFELFAVGNVSKVIFKTSQSLSLNFCALGNGLYARQTEKLKQENELNKNEKNEKRKKL